MDKTQHEKSRAGMENSALVLSVAIIFISCLVWSGWHWGIEPLKRGFPTMVPMNPATAFCFIFSGGGLILQILRPDGLSARMAGMLVLILGSIKMAAYLGFVTLQFDQWFFSSDWEIGKSDSPNRMAPNTALCFGFVGVALLLPCTLATAQVRVAEIAAMLTGLVAMLSILGYIYQIRWLYGFASHLPMALPTAVAFLILAISILLAKPRCGVMAVATSDTPGGLLLQRSLPAVVSLLVLAGGIRLLGERNGYFNSEHGVALFTVTSIGLFCVFLVSCAVSMHQVELKRRQAESGIVQLNAELLQQKSQLELLNREMESFSYSVSHDLRAPLRGIAGFAEALEERAQDVLDETSRSYLKRIRIAGGRMGGLIDDLLLLSRLSRSDMKCRTVDLSRLASKAITELRQQDPARNVEVTITPGIKVAGDPSLLKILLDNLLGNGWKFTAPKSEARIELGIRPESETSTHIQCYIRDNGVGFDNRYRHKLFGAFQRLHSFHEFPGTGIGLATVQRILHRHGGDISAHGEIESGACFDFTLPKP